MSLNKIYSFNVAANYNFDPNKIEITGGVARLLLQRGLVSFTQNFDNDTGFIYNSDEALFSGGQVEQKDKRPAGSTFYASYTNSINGSWGDGVLIGSGFGGAAVAGGALDLKYSDIRYVDYNADQNADSQQTGCVRLRFKPNYSGSPVGDTIVMFTICRSVGLGNNMILLQHTIVGQINIGIFDSAGVGIIQQNMGMWNPVSGTIYEFELNWDITTGATRLFLDGTQFGVTRLETGIRDNNIGLLVIGSNLDHTKISNFEILDFLVFSNVQHISNYTPNWSNIYETIYLETSVILPEMEHTGDGSIHSFDNFITIEAGSPRKVLQVGRSGIYLYWNGLAWVASDGSYSQANDTATFNTNAPSLDVEGEKYGQFKIIFPGSNTISSISQLTAVMNVDIGYPTNNPTIEPVGSIPVEGIERFEDFFNKTGLDTIKYIRKKNSKWYYYNGTAWVESDGTYSQSNTAAEIDDSKDIFTTTGIIFNWRAFIHSDDGTTTPELQNVILTYNFYGQSDSINKCIVWGYNKNDEDETFTVQLCKDAVKYKDNIIVRNEIFLVSPDANTGYWEIELIENENMEPNSFWIFNFNGKKFYLFVKNEIAANFWDLVNAT